MRSQPRTPRPAVTDPSVHVGPALYELSPDDDEGVRELFAEQRARLEVVRRHEIWDCLGGVRGASVRWVYLHVASLPAMALALIVAGFTRGPVLWSACALAFGLVLAGSISRHRQRREWIPIYRRGELRPAVVVAFDPKLTSDPVTPRWMHVLVGMEVGDSAALRRLVGTGDGLRAMVERRADVPGGLVAFVEPLRNVGREHGVDGSRIEAPGSLKAGRAELACIRVNPAALPEERLTSRLFFALVDPTHRGARSTLQVPGEIWGACAVDLCRHFPIETA